MTFHRHALASLVLLVTATAVAPTGCAVITSPREEPSPPPGEWRSYGGTLANAKYSPLDQVNAANVRQLRIAWRWKSPDHDVMDRNSRIETFVNEARRSWSEACSTSARPSARSCRKASP